MSRWLVTGATGLLGSNALLLLQESHDVIGTARVAPTNLALPFIEADLSAADTRRGLVREAHPNVVLHAAALSSIEACASDPALAAELNVHASVDLAAQAAEIGAKFIFISTDAVFDGTKGSYSESEPTSPISVYGRTKVQAEEAVLEANPDALVARVNFYGWSPTGQRSLAEFFYHRLARGESVTGFQDTIVSTLYVDYLVESLAHLVEAKVCGVVHVSSAESTSKYDFGRRLASTFGFAPELVVPGISSDFLPQSRGAQLNMRNDRFEQQTGIPMPGQQAGLDRLLADMKSGRREELHKFTNLKEV